MYSKGLDDFILSKLLHNAFGSYRKFLEYESVLKQHSVTCSGDVFSKIGSVADYRSFIIPARDKICSRLAEPVELTINELSLPFDKIFVETYPFAVNWEDEEKPFSALVCGMFFSEISPGVVAPTSCAASIEFAPSGTAHKVNGLVFWRDGEIRPGTFYLREENYPQAMVLKILSEANKRDTITGIAKAKEKMRHGRALVSDIVIVNRKEQEAVSRGHCVKIDWKHRWEVMGHWRKHPGKLGKDRDGSRTKMDWTWVVPHERGAEDMPVVKKTRIYTGEQNEHI